MTDAAETPQPPPLPLVEENTVFRETFLVWIDDPEVRAAFRRVGAFLYDAALDHRGPFDDNPESFLRAELRAVAVELRHLQSYLAYLGREREGSALSPEEQEGSRVAETEAPAVGAVAARIESALGVPPPGAVVENRPLEFNRLEPGRRTNRPNSSGWIAEANDRAAWTPTETPGPPALAPICLAAFGRGQGLAILHHLASAMREGLSARAPSPRLPGTSSRPGTAR